MKEDPMKGRRIKPETRERSDMALQMIRMFIRGQSPEKIGRAVGCSSINAHLTIKRIIADDMAFSGEPPEIVMAAYERNKR